MSRKNKDKIAKLLEIIIITLFCIMIVADVIVQYILHNIELAWIICMIILMIIAFLGSILALITG